MICKRINLLLHHPVRRIVLQYVLSVCGEVIVAEGVTLSESDAAAAPDCPLLPKPARRD